MWVLSMNIPARVKICPNVPRVVEARSTWISICLVSFCLCASLTVLAQELQLESRIDHVGTISATDFATRTNESFDGRSYSGLHLTLTEESPFADPRTHRVPPNLNPPRVGVNRVIPQEYTGDIASTLNWQEEIDGRIVSTISVTSPGAAAIRLQMRAHSLTNAEFRYFELSEDGVDRLVYEQSVQPPLATSMQPMSIWSPTIQSDQAGVEIVLPNWESLSNFTLELQQVSHFSQSISEGAVVSNSANPSQCNNHIDVQCAADQLAPNKETAVGRILVQKDGGPSFCTGTLLNSKDVSIDPLSLGDGPAPYLLTSNTCVSNQEEANSLEITWLFQRDYCGSEKLDHRAATTFGGGELLATSVAQDASLIRLRNDLPGGLVYSGWRASRLAVPADAHVIHHPGGDVKKISSGTATSHVVLDSLTDAIRVEWKEGAAEQGSEGGGLFVDGYLIGNLSQNSQACEMGVSHFGAFEKFYPNVSGYLLGDHGDEEASATSISVPISLQETLSPGDNDYFRIEITEANRLTVYSEGETDTVGTLILDGEDVVEDDNGGLGDNFLIRRDLEPGVYLLRVRGNSESTAGSYRLRTSFDGGSAPTTAPSNIQVVRGLGQLEVTWDSVPPSGNGGSPITGYTAVATNEQGHSQTCTTIVGDTSCVISALTPGLEYTIYVRAKNAFGEGPDSSAVTVVPLQSEGTRLLVAPTNVRTSIDHTENSLSVFWDPIPEDSGRVNVIRYTVQAVAGDQSLSCQAEANVMTCVLSGFEDGVTYSLTVYAESAAGAGPHSEQVLVTPVHSDDHGGTIDTAYAVGVNSDTAANLGADDLDYFRIDVTERGTLYLWTEGSTDTYGSLHSETEDIIGGLFNRDSGQGGNFSMWNVTDPGTYYVLVKEDRGATGRYTLSVSFVVDDHGDDVLHATGVETESETPGYLAHGDQDYFRIEVTERGTLYLETLGSTDTYGSLHSETADIIGGLFNRDSGQGDNFSMWKVINPGTYYVLVKGDRSSIGSYALSVSFIVDDHGDDVLNATSVETESMTPGYLAHGDQDYFRIEVTERGTLYMETLGSTDTFGSLHSETEDIDGGISSRDSGQGDNFSMWAVTDPGTYFVRVKEDHSATGQYTLSVSFVVDDHGDDLYSATSVETESMTTGYLAHGDQDYFSIEITERGTLHLETLGSTDTYGSLHSETEDIDGGLSSQDSGQGENFSMSAVTDPGTYFVLVKEESGATGHYTFSVSFVIDEQSDGSVVTPILRYPIERWSILKRKN